MAEFKAILSSSIKISDQNTMVTETVVKMIVLAKSLLPMFLLIRLMAYYF